MKKVTAVITSGFDGKLHEAIRSFNDLGLGHVGCSKIEDYDQIQNSERIFWSNDKIRLEVAIPDEQVNSVVNIFKKAVAENTNDFDKDIIISSIDEVINPDAKPRHQKFKPNTGSRVLDFLGREP